jgi:hypothetical protein
MQQCQALPSAEHLSASLMANQNAADEKAWARHRAPECAR